VGCLPNSYSRKENHRSSILRDDCEKGGVPCPPSEEEAEGLLLGTVKFWQDWLSVCTYHGRWRDQTRRPSHFGGGFRSLRRWTSLSCDCRADQTKRGGGPSLDCRTDQRKRSHPTTEANPKNHSARPASQYFQFIRSAESGDNN
jgi:hypothetical protein